MGDGEVITDSKHGLCPKNCSPFTLLSVQGETIIGDVLQGSGLGQILFNILEARSGLGWKEPLKARHQIILPVINADVFD